MKISHFITGILLYYFLYPFCVRYLSFPTVDSFYVSSLVFLVYVVQLGTKRAGPSGSSQSAYIRIFIVLLILVGLSAILNESNPYVVLKATLAYYFEALLVYLIITRSELSEDASSWIVRLCFLLIALQIPVALLQFLFGNYGNADSNSGTISSFNLGGTGINAVLMSYLAARAAAKMLVSGENVRGIATILLASIPIVVGGAKFGLFLLPVVLLSTIVSASYLGLRFGISQFKSVAATLFSVSAVAAIVFFVVIPASPLLSRFLEFDVFVDQDARATYDREAGRTIYYEVIWNEAKESIPNFLVGYGSETVSSSSSIGVESRWTRIIDTDVTTGVSFLLSLGVLGILLLFVALLQAIPLTRESYAGIGGQDEEHQVDTISILPITLASLLSMGYIAFWSSQAGLVYWILVGVAVVRLNRRGSRVTQGLHARSRLSA